MAPTVVVPTPPPAPADPVAEEWTDDRLDELAEPTTEEIAARAYELYQARGGQDGSDVDDWLAAERDLKARRVQQ
jgi:hypothetical protein